MREELIMPIATLAVAILNSPKFVCEPGDRGSAAKAAVNVAFVVLDETMRRLKERQLEEEGSKS